MATLYRAMIKDSDGKPLVVPTARGLGVRPVIDIPVDDEGRVEPESGGMSVARDDPAYLPPHRRPPSHGGTGSDPVWEIDEEELGEALVCRLDVPPEGHGLVEPLLVMTLDDYELALAETRDGWREVP
jgi:hypothetical protein